MLGVDSSLDAFFRGVLVLDSDLITNDAWASNSCLGGLVGVRVESLLDTAYSALLSSEREVSMSSLTMVWLIVMIIFLWVLIS